MNPTFAFQTFIALNNLHFHSGGWGGGGLDNFCFFFDIVDNKLGLNLPLEARLFEIVLFVFDVTCWNRSVPWFYHRPRIERMRSPVAAMHGDMPPSSRRMPRYLFFRRFFLFPYTDQMPD
jgi:hypothetical protein